jgi:hypothetical protein
MKWRMTIAFLVTAYFTGGAIWEGEPLNHVLVVLGLVGLPTSVIAVTSHIMAQNERAERTYFASQTAQCRSGSPNQYADYGDDIPRPFSHNHMIGQCIANRNGLYTAGEHYLPEPVDATARRQPEIIPIRGGAERAVERHWNEKAQTPAQAPQPQFVSLAGKARADAWAEEVASGIVREKGK